MKGRFSRVCLLPSSRPDPHIMMQLSRSVPPPSRKRAALEMLALIALFLLFVGIPRYALEDTITLMDVNDHASFHYPVPIPGNETLCTNGVSVQKGNPVALEDGMSYTLFATGNGKCAYKTQVRVVTWRGLFS